MSLADPDWLTQHAGELRPSPANQNWFVFFRNEPQYRLDLHPAGGKFGTEIVQTNNGRHVASGEIADSAEGALQKGLEALRNVLGW